MKTKTRNIVAAIIAGFIFAIIAGLTAYGVTAFFAGNKTGLWVGSIVLTIGWIWNAIVQYKAVETSKEYFDQL